MEQESPSNFKAQIPFKPMDTWRWKQLQQILPNDHSKYVQWNLA